MRNMQTIFKTNGNTGQKVTVTAASPVTAAALSDQCYAADLYATQDMYLNIDIAVNKTGATGLSYFLPKTTLVRMAMDGKNVITAQADTTDGVLHISELTS